MRAEKMKKGYIFLLDGIFAVILLVMGLIIISSTRSEQTTDTPLALTLDNSVGLFASVKVSDLCSGCNCSVKKLKDLCIAGEVKNSQNTLLDYIGELYSRNKMQEAFLLIDNISQEKDIFREQELFGAEILVNGNQVYPNTDVSVEKKRSKNLLSSKRMIFGYYEDPSTGSISNWGPYELEADIWEKR